MRTLRIKVTTGAKTESVSTLADGRLAVSVRADRKGGAANDRMRVLLARHFSVPEEKIHIVSGHTSPTKTVRIT